MSPEQKEAWFAANISAMFGVLRALAEANKENPAFISELQKQLEVRAAHRLNSTMSDPAVAFHEQTLRDLLPKELHHLV